MDYIFSHNEEEGFEHKITYLFVSYSKWPLIVFHVNYLLLEVNRNSINIISLMVLKILNYS